jgi:hypothetical protein
LPVYDFVRLSVANALGSSSCSRVVQAGANTLSPFKNQQETNEQMLHMANELGRLLTRIDPYHHNSGQVSLLLTRIATCETTAFVLATSPVKSW